MLRPAPITKALARRLEGTSQIERRAYMQMHRMLFPERTVATLEIGGALATICGSHVHSETLGHRAFSRCIGLGFDEPVTNAMIDELESFYAAHDIDVRIDVCPFADPTLLEVLRARGYTVETFLNTWFRSADPVDFQPDPSISLTIASEAERGLWAETIGRGFASDDEIPMDPISHTVCQLAGKSLFLAWIEGAAAGAAGANICDSIGLVNGAATRPGYRNRGVQQALLAARINHLAGKCELMAVVSAPGAGSERNIQRFGFQLLHTKPIMIKVR